MTEWVGEMPELGRSGLTGGLSEQTLVLDRFNGRPTVLLATNREGQTWLAWHADDYPEDGHLWFYVPVNDEEAMLLVDDPPELLDEWLMRRRGRTVFVGFEQHGQLDAVFTWVVEFGPKESLSKVVVGRVRKALREAMHAEEDPERRQQLADEERAVELAL